ncbi:SMI1/KNR4 family protein [Streptomyces avicenniae]|uniref:SMI1/KNR4 family protein n=1 Tax=Streptomyces avicenniae TaxID=500153 RepID=UPI000DA61256|nr:SMI1/KNR4 family protein [Streptomyces avicenniae]
MALDRRILEMMPPSPNAGESIDWSQIAGSWGTEFPNDYRGFVDTYGLGTIEEFLVVFVPEPGRLPEGFDMRSESKNVRQVWSEDIRRRGAEGVQGDHLIAWGADAGADILCWDASVPDPNTWPVVVFRRQGIQHWRRYECGMIQFLTSTFLGRLGENPLSGTHLWCNSNPRFLHQRDEELSLARGIDPWTGEPDPYAGMFG